MDLNSLRYVRPWSFCCVWDDSAKFYSASWQSPRKLILCCAHSAKFFLFSCMVFYIKHKLGKFLSVIFSGICVHTRTYTALWDQRVISCSTEESTLEFVYTCGFYSTMYRRQHGICVMPGEIRLLNAGRIHHRIYIVFPTQLSDKTKARKINVSDIQRNLCTALCVVHRGIL